MIKTRRQIMYELRDYASPKSKMTQMVKRGELIRVCRGVYVSSLDDPRFPVASLISSPCYISFQTALSYYQLIPEKVYAVMSAGFRLKKDKRYQTPLGLYSFHYLPEQVFSAGIVPAEEQGYGFRIASAEKALCDTLYKIRSITTLSAMESLLIEDLRIDRERLMGLDWEMIGTLIPRYHSATLNTFLSWRNRYES